MVAPRLTASGSDDRALASGAVDRQAYRRFLAVPEVQTGAVTASSGEPVGPAPVPDAVSALQGRPPGQAFTDLLLLGALACQTPVAVLSVPRPDGSWSTLTYGFDTQDGCNDAQLFAVLAAATEPVEIADLSGRLPRSSLVLPPHSMRWAYGVALRQEAGQVIGVVAVLDRWLRQVSKREQRALGSLARQLGAELTQWRRPGSPSASTLATAARLPSVTPTVSPAGDGSAMVSDRHHLLRSQEVAEIFDVTERTVINWAAAGKLPSLRTIGGHLRFRREDVLRLLGPTTP